MAKVTQALKCNKCGMFIPSDQSQAVIHAIKFHNVKPGPYAHNMADTFFRDSKVYTIAELNALKVQAENQINHINEILSELDQE